jgi:hypothetical protein
MMVEIVTIKSWTDYNTLGERYKCAKENCEKVSLLGNLTDLCLSEGKKIDRYVRRGAFIKETGRMNYLNYIVGLTNALSTCIDVGKVNKKKYEKLKDIRGELAIGDLTYVTFIIFESDNIIPPPQAVFL